MASPSPFSSFASFLRAWIADLHLATVFLTRLPLPPLGALGEGALARSMRAFPLAGALVGFCAGLVYWAASALLTPALAGLAAVAASVWLTGAMHEDGLADVADGLGGGRDRAHKLEIMHDSRVGSYAVAALIFSIALRSQSVAALADGGKALAALVAAAAVSRAALPVMMAAWVPARRDGLAVSTGRPGGGVAATAAGLGLLLLLVCLGLKAALAALATALCLAAVVWVLARRGIGGYTGDVLGATQQAMELGVLLAVVGMR